MMMWFPVRQYQHEAVSYADILADSAYSSGGSQAMQTAPQVNEADTSIHQRSSNQRQWNWKDKGKAREHHNPQPNKPNIPVAADPTPSQWKLKDNGKVQQNPQPDTAEADWHTVGERRLRDFRASKLPVNHFTENADTDPEAAWRHNHPPTTTRELPPRFDPTSTKAEPIVTRYGIRFGVIEQVAAKTGTFIVTKFAGPGKKNEIMIWGPRDNVQMAIKNIEQWILQSFESKNQAKFPKIRSMKQNEIWLEEEEYERELRRQKFRRDAEPNARFAFRVYIRSSLVSSSC